MMHDSVRQPSPDGEHPSIVPCIHSGASSTIQSSPDTNTTEELVRLMCLGPSSMQSDLQATFSIAIGAASFPSRCDIDRPAKKAKSQSPPSSVIRSELVNAREAALRCGVSRTHWYDMKNAGRIPLPIHLGRSVLWRVEELKQWMEADCPPLHEWKRIKEQQNRTKNRGSR